LALSNKKNRIKFLREFESIFKTALAHESGKPGTLFNEKNKGKKSCESVPLSESLHKAKKLGIGGEILTPPVGSFSQSIAFCYKEIGGIH
jgi:hypothetical protein